MNRSQENGRGFPKIAGILLGLGLGGFFDGILLHQVLQWHHMFTSAGYPADNLDNLKFNVMWEGFFHISTYIFTATGMTILWWKALQSHDPWSGKMLIGTMLMGFGIFNLVEGIIDHQLLGIHHVNETVPPQQWILWDVGFLIWGALMLVGGWLLLQAGERKTAQASPEWPMARYSKKSSDEVKKTVLKQNRGLWKAAGLAKKVTSRKQAVAIGLSEARKKGTKVPRKKPAKSMKKSSSKKRS